MEKQKAPTIEELQKIEDGDDKQDEYEEMAYYCEEITKNTRISAYELQLILGGNY